MIMMMLTRKNGDYSIDNVYDYADNGDYDDGD